MIIKELIINLSILITLLFLYTQITASSPLTRTSSLRGKIAAGILCGILSNILMYFGIHAIGSQITLFDLRHIPAFVAAYYGGPVPALITSGLTIFGRFFMTKGMAPYLAIIVSLSGTLFAIYVTRMNLSKKLIINAMITVNNIVFSAAFIYLNKHTVLILKTLPFYWIVSYLSAYIAFYLIQYIRNFQVLYKKYEQEATIDGLTGLNNVRKFNEIYNSILNEAVNSQMKFSILYIDIDLFKRVNDKYGHERGDIVLKESAYRIQHAAGAQSIICRKGGEEFIVLLPFTTLEEAVSIAEDIRRSVETKPYLLQPGKTINMTISIGVANYSETTKDPDQMMNDADISLYNAKQSGRNKVCIAGFQNKIN